MNSMRPEEQQPEVINLAEGMDEQKLREIGMTVVREYLIDFDTQSGWIEDSEKHLEMAEQVMKEKSTPWVGAANVKLPLIADAAIKFQSRAYAEIAKDGKPVKASIIGDDKDNSKHERGQRVAGYMGWQLMEGIEEWDPDTDKLLMMLPIIGHVYRKNHYDHSLGRTTSYLLLPNRLIVNNKHTTSLKTARRATEKLVKIRSEIKSLQNAGAYLDIPLIADNLEGEPLEDDNFKLLEQHRWLDLDDDGIDEPYVVVVHEATQKVLHISSRYDESDVVLSQSGNKVIRIEAQQSYSDYAFIPAFNGTYLGQGLGKLLFGLNDAANTMMNQLLDAATANNSQSGVLSAGLSSALPGGTQRFKPGEWKKTKATAEEVSKGMQPLPISPPSNTLYMLLGFVIDMAKDVASIKDVLSGEAPGSNVPATTIAMLVEQGMKTYTAIYKRIHRSLKAEFKQIYKLNYKYLDEEEYYKVSDSTKIAYRDDFSYQDCDVVPVSDPNMASDMQRLAMAEARLKALELPGVNPKPIVRGFIEALKFDNIEEVLPEEMEQQPSPEMVKMKAEMEYKNKQLDLKMKEFEAEAANKHAQIAESMERLQIERDRLKMERDESEARTDKFLADAIRSLADAEAKEGGQQLANYKAALEGIGEINERRRSESAGSPGDGGKPRDVVSPPNDMQIHEAGQGINSPDPDILG